MSNNPLPELFSTFQSEAFRLETLSQYRVHEEQADLERYLDGETFPEHASHGEWLDALTRWSAAGKRIVRVRVLPRPLTPYVNFEIDWGYIYNAQHGEDIYLLPEGEFRERFGDDLHDWWMFDGKTSVRMVYSNDGSFAGAGVASSDTDYQEIRRHILEHAMPLKEYLRRRRTRPE